MSRLGRNLFLKKLFDRLLQPIQEWLNGLEIKKPFLAKLICTIIPTQCPFERDLILFGYQIASIPPLCKINPFYEQLVYLRFRSLCYLANECQINISRYV